MAFRKRRTPAPAFRQPAPYDPIGGDHALIGREGLIDRVSMMQIIGDDDTVAGQDTHDDYVICRGYDPETMRFHHRLSIAKPYGVRGRRPYKLAEVYTAMKAGTRLGDNPGVAASSTGHPEDLDEAIDLLYDDNGHPIYWILLDHGRDREAIQLAEDHPGRGTLFDVWLGTENATTHGWTYDTDNKFDCIDWRCCESCGLPYPDKCATGFAFWRKDGVLEVFDLDCCAPDDDYYCSGGAGS